MEPEYIYEELLQEISDKGYSVVGAHSDVPFYYSVGALDKIGFEIYLEAINPSTAELLIDSLISVWVKNEREPSDGAYVLLGLAKYGYRLGLVEVDDPIVIKDRALYAAAHNENRAFKTYQLVFPDTSNKLPWEAGYDDLAMSTQTVYRKSIFKGEPNKDVSLTSAVEIDFTSRMVQPESH